MRRWRRMPGRWFRLDRRWCAQALRPGGVAGGRSVGPRRRLSPCPWFRSWVRRRQFELLDSSTRAWRNRLRPFRSKRLRPAGSASTGRWAGMRQRTVVAAKKKPRPDSPSLPAPVRARRRRSDQSGAALLAPARPAPLPCGLRRSSFTSSNAREKTPWIHGYTWPWSSRPFWPLR